MRNFINQVVCAVLAALAMQAVQGATPEVRLSQEPLFSGRANVHSNLLLSLSVEFPTVGVAYRADNGTYNRTRDYIGYFNARKCYVYHGGNRNLGDEAYFVIYKDANQTTRECGGDSFSGNFMNWAASSAIDMLRYALTGGDRVIDRADLTVLQRAVLRDGPSANFYAHETYFPRRKVQAGGNVSAPGQVTPFDVSTLYVVSCRNRILFSDTSSGLVGSKESNSAHADSYCSSKYKGTGKPSSEAVDKKLGEYLARVRVCDVAEGATRSDLCMKYGEHYKPVGELQRRAGVVRVGAMGYLLDDSAQRYGGVLRSPLKYLGATRHEAPGFERVANDRPEWHPETGIFYADPDNPAEREGAGKSGAINYLNKFGRNAQYKTYDPVGELYYEGLRYLQGKQPTAEAVAGANAAMRDGFPVLEHWIDPVVASCQRNYILAIADVNTHWDRYIPGNERTTYGANRDAFDPVRPADVLVAGKTPSLDVMAWTQKVGEMEVDADGVHSNPTPNAGLVNLHVQDTGAGGHGTAYMAGLAYWANTNDIRLDKPVRVKTVTIDVDEGGNGELDGNTRSINPRSSQLYLAAKYGGFHDKNDDGNPFVTLAADDKTLVHDSNTEWSDGDGVPSSYFLAGQPREMIDAVRRVFAKIAADSGTLSGVSLSSGKLTAGGAHIYQPGFNSSRWSGKLRKLPLTLDDALTVSASTSADWEAGEILTGTAMRAARPSPEERRIYTLATQDNTATTVEFKWDDILLAQRAMLDTSPSDGQADGLGVRRLHYLRGARDQEVDRDGGIFRRRDSVLGDIVNSNPVYVGAPSLRVTGHGYGAFFKRYRNRTPAVYIGANDGMLHAFDAENGSELFAYVPNVLIAALPQLTSPEYVHRAYVDGGLAVGEARSGGRWKTVLAGSTGAGAQAVFALDVSNPASFHTGSGALFEFSDADDPDLGNVIGKPAIAKFRTGIKNGLPQYAYFVVVASGVNNYLDDGKGRFNDDAASALFLLSLDKPQTSAWKLGRNYYKFRLPAASASAQNGLAQPAMVVGSDGAVQYAYAGDLQGNLWRLDFTGVAPWVQPAAGTQTLFVARNVDGERQPITSRPSVVFARGGYIVLFGTGKFLEPADAAPGNFSMQSFYAIFDTAHGQHAVSGRSELAQRGLRSAETGGFMIEGERFEYGDEEGAKRGWYFDFPGAGGSGERAISTAAVLNGSIFFNSVIPGTDPCEAGGGRSYALSALTGLSAAGFSTGYLSQVGMLSAPVVLETDAKIGIRNAIGRREVQRRRSIINVGTGGAKGTVFPAEGGNEIHTVRAGRLSWREIPNLQEMRNAGK